MNDNPLIALAGYFALLSLFAVGGANAAIPEMHRIAVEVMHWMSDRQFADSFAISQVSPGPNIIIVTLIGYHVAGLAGAAVATAAMCGPTCVAGVPRRAHLGSLQGCSLAHRHSGRPGSGVARVDRGQRIRARTQCGPQYLCRRDYCHNGAWSALRLALIPCGFLRLVACWACPAGCTAGRTSVDLPAGAYRVLGISGGGRPKTKKQEERIKSREEQDVRGGEDLRERGRVSL